MQQYNNYWNLYLKEFPSKGLLYDKEASIRIRPLNVQELKYLTTINEQNCTDLINEILLKCIILDKIKFEDLLISDREYLVYWLRSNSFTNNSGYTMNVSCEKCGEEYKKEIELTEFPIKYLEDTNNANRTIYLPDSNIQLCLKQPRITDLRRQFKDIEIESFLRYIEIDEYNEDILINFLLKLSALDYTILKNNIEEMYIGFERIITDYCPKCGEAKQYTIQMTDKGLFGNVSMFEIMEVILQISKYTNYQIQDNMPWWEVEAAQVVANKMAEDEKQELEKKDGKVTLYNNK